MELKTFNYFILICIIWCITVIKCSYSSEPVDFYSFTVLDSDGRDVSLEQYRGKVSLVVNVASECGFTDGHYRSLIRLKNVLSVSERFEILAFPCNQFGQQEPGSNDEIQQFVLENYHANFPVFAKVDVLGENASDAWKYLTESHGKSPEWNFWKYLVDENGKVLTAWGPHKSVEDIFHDVKEVVDKIGQQKPQFTKHHRHSHMDEL